MSVCLSQIDDVTDRQTDLILCVHIDGIDTAEVCLCVCLSQID